MKNVGPRSPVDVGNTVNEIRNVAGSVSPEIGDPLQARATTLMSRAIPPSPTLVGPSRPQVPFEVAQSWRTNLGNKYENLPPVRGAPFGRVYPAITQDMRSGAAASPGQVPPAAFDTAMNISRNEAGANELGASLDKTLGRPSATGEKNFAQKMSELSQPGMGYEYRQFSGQPAAGQPASPNDISQQLADLALVARHDYTPPVQGGASAAVGNVVSKVATPGSTAAIGALLHMLSSGPCRIRRCRRSRSVARRLSLGCARLHAKP